MNIEKDCPQAGCRNGRVHAGTMLEEQCEICKGKGKIKGAGVWQDTRGRAHDVIWMGSLAAKALLRREMSKHTGDGPPVISLPLTNYFKLSLSKDGTTNGRGRSR